MNKIDISEMFERMEPEAARSGEHVSSVGEAALVSIAISLKRLADTHDGTAAGLCVTETVFGARQ
jgi:hypothetical protein